MSSKQFAVVLTECIVPRAGRIPSDLAALESACPIELSLAAIAPRLLDRTKANYIGELIASALRGE